MAMVLRSQSDVAISAQIALGDEKYTAMVSSGMEPGFIEFLNSNAYYFQEQSEKSFEEFKDALDVQPRSDEFQPLTEELIREGFSFFAYDFPMREKHYGFYKVGSSNILLVVYPLELSRRLYEKNKEKK